MKRLVLSMAVLFFLACGGRGEDAIAEVALCDTDFVTLHCERVRYTATEQRLLALGLVDVQMLDPTIRVHLVYSTEDNFLGRVLYTDIHRALLHPTMATKVAAAQQALHRERPDLDLLILDAARPLSVQYQMFHVVAGTPQNRYVANPKKGPGMHNYGAAVDVTLVDHEGNWLPMGSDFEHIDNEAHLLATGKITQEEYDNRRLLRRIMRQQGLLPLTSEWWHYNLMTTAQARRTLRAIE